MPYHRADPTKRAFAKTQRSVMTAGEAALWQALRAHRLRGVKFKRQVPIGPYVVDFLCPSARIVVEVDGPSHERLNRQARDAARSAWLVTQGFRVLHFSDDEVLGGLPLVCEQILKAAEG